MNKNLISKRWNTEAKNLVTNNKFSELYVYDSVHGMSVDEAKRILANTVSNPPNLTTKCEFCGNNLRYVALIHTEIKSNTVIKQVGCDCLGLVLGLHNPLYRSVKRNVRKLASEAKRRKQIDENMKEYSYEYMVLKEVIGYGIPMASIISSMKHAIETGRTITSSMKDTIKNIVRKIEYNSHKYSKLIQEITTLYNDDSHRKFNSFECDIYSALIGGRNITDKMERALKNIIKVRTPEMSVNMDTIMKKVNELIRMVEFVDGNRIYTYYRKFTPMDFLESIRNQAVSGRVLTEPQMRALNRIHRKYKSKEERKIKKQEKKKKSA